MSSALPLSPPIRASSWTPLRDFHSPDPLFCGVQKILKFYHGRRALTLRMGAWLTHINTPSPPVISCRIWSGLTRQDVAKIVATRCHILQLKCTKFDFGWGSAPDPAGGAYSAPPDPLAGSKGPYF